MVIVAAKLDASSEHVINYLNDNGKFLAAVPLNCMYLSQPITLNYTTTFWPYSEALRGT
jgi:hypothetical protein